MTTRGDFSFTSSVQTTLLPSIMPATHANRIQPPSASKPYPLPAKVRSQPLPVSPRPALLAFDNNIKRLPSTAIPRPAPQPDVFAPSPKGRKHSESSYSNKRARVEKPTDDWVARWRKTFPTLVFYFEDGIDERVKQKISKLGATIDPFFSSIVTHLIVRDRSIRQDLASKAADMGIKVWNLKKLGGILGSIAPSALAATDSLRTLLEDEKLHGTRERDLSAPRPDHYYFKPGNKYTLVEDATGRHRPIMAKEYAPSDAWPVLHETFLRISTPGITPIDKLRDRAWSLYVDGQPFEDEQPPGELRRTTSMRNITTTPSLPQPTPYQNASGNTVVSTSNIASTSNPSPAIVLRDKNIVQLSKRVQVLKGNATRNNPPRRPPTCQPQKTFMTQDQVIKMLRQAREPIREDSCSKEMRIANHHKVYDAGKGREQDTAAGYCENCRIRYTDLSMHIVTKKHLRFARDDQNFVELDRLLDTLRRPDFGLQSEEED